MPRDEYRREADRTQARRRAHEREREAGKGPDAADRWIEWKLRQLHATKGRRKK